MPAVHLPIFPVRRKDKRHCSSRSRSCPCQQVSPRRTVFFDSFFFSSFAHPTLQLACTPCSLRDRTSSIGSWRLCLVLVQCGSVGGVGQKRRKGGKPWVRENVCVLMLGSFARAVSIFSFQSCVQCCQCCRRLPSIENPCALANCIVLQP